MARGVEARMEQVTDAVAQARPRGRRPDRLTASCAAEVWCRCWCWAWSLRAREVREPVHGAHRGDDRGRALGEPQHDVPAAAPARGSRPDQGGVGASRATLATLPRPHEPGAGGIARGSWRRSGLSRFRQVVDRRDRERGVQGGRARARHCGRAADARGRAGAQVRRRRAGRRSSRASATCSSAPRAGPPSRSASSGSRPPAAGEDHREGRGAGAGSFATIVFEEALEGRQTLTVHAPDGAQVELSLEYTLTKYGPVSSSPTPC